jgi:hypothetical protein
VAENAAPRPLRGVFASLTPAQRKDALNYRGDEDHGDPEVRNLDQIIASLPPRQRAKVLARGRELIAEELALRHVRQSG